MLCWFISKQQYLPSGYVTHGYFHKEWLDIPCGIMTRNGNLQEFTNHYMLDFRLVIQIIMIFGGAIKI